MQNKRIYKNLYLPLVALLLGNFTIAKANEPSLAALSIPTSGAHISSNPAAENIVVSSGVLQKYIDKAFGIQNDHGVRIGGAWLGDVNDLFSGGIPDAQRWTSNSSFLLGLTAETEQSIGIPGGLFNVSFLQFNGQATNEQAGTVQGYNSLTGPPPLDRSQLYQLWYRQEFLDKKLFIRIGKSVPTYNFDNVSKPIPLSEEKLFIPAVSGLIFTPLFVNSTMLGVMPGYYNSAYGVTTTYAPTRKWYLSLGAFDGNLARGEQTGLHDLPSFNGSYFYIGETGLAWLLGKNRLPGYIGTGLWQQTGPIKNSDNMENGASGLYVFGTQRLWYKNPGQDISGISAFYQYGINNSSVLANKQYVGAGLTAFGLIANRLNDSIGVGTALSWLNQTEFNRNTELMLQAYYQAQIIKNIYVEPAISYIPTPGANDSDGASWAGTARLIVLF